MGVLDVKNKWMLLEKLQAKWKLTGFEFQRIRKSYIVISNSEPAQRISGRLGIF